jgi:spermidine synthase
VLVYGFLELGVALSALAVPLGLRGAQSLLLALFGGQPDLPDASQSAINLYYGAAAFVLLMIPTAFMGATLPLLVRHAVSRDADVGKRIGALYAWNTFGAVMGTLLTAFGLLPLLGLSRTVAVAVAVNALVFVLACLIARGAEGPAPEAGSRRETAAQPLPFSWILPAIAMSGFVSFTGEVLWTRLLAHLIGASVYAFASMLASFLLGIAIGSAAASRLATDAARATRVFALVQLGAGLLTLVAYLVADRLPGWLPVPSDPYAGIAIGALASMAVLLPAALCFGATYPLAVRILARGPDDASLASARVYSWNTVGAIAGALAAASFVQPLLGFAGTVKAMVLLNVLIAAAGLFAQGSARRGLLVVPGILALGVVLLPLGPPLRLIGSGSGMGAETGELRYLGVGRSSTVMLADPSPRGHRLRTNGLPEAMIRGRGRPLGADRTLRYMAVLPSLLRPDTRSLVVVGLGGGVSLENVPKSVEEMHVIELEPEVVTANQIIGSERAVDPLQDPRVSLHLNDARTALLLTGRRFDAIVAQASHPWTAGASHLYSLEFFRLVASRLTDDGVFVQWMGAPFVDRFLLRTVLATLLEVWPHVRVDQLSPASFVFSASAAPLVEPDVDALLAVDAEAARAAGLTGSIDIDAIHVMGGERLASFTGDAPVNQDDRNHLQMRSPIVRGTPESLARAPLPELSVWDEELVALPETDAVALVRARAERVSADSAARLIPLIDDATDRSVAEAILALEGRRASAARPRLRLALERDPGHVEARAALLRAGAPGALLGAPLPTLPEGPARAAEGAVVAALQLLREGRIEALPQAVGAELEAIPPGDPLYTLAVELRARAGAGHPEEAVGLVDEGLRIQPENWPLMRLRFDLLAGWDPEAAVDTLERLVRSKGRPMTAVEARSLGQQASELPLEGAAARQRDALADSLVRARQRAAPKAGG